MKRLLSLVCLLTAVVAVSGQVSRAPLTRIPAAGDGGDPPDPPAFVDIPGGGVHYPAQYSGNMFSAFVSVSGTIMNASGEGNAVLFRVPKTGTLDTIELRWGAVADQPDNPLRVSFQDVTSVSSAGANDGVQDQFRDVSGPFTAGAWVTPGLITSDGTDTGSKRSVTHGQRMAIVWDFTSFVAGDSVQPFSLITAGDYAVTELFFRVPNVGNNTNSYVVGVVLKYSDGTYVALDEDDPPYMTRSQINVASNSTPDEVGNRFQLAFSAKVDGATCTADWDGNADIILYDASNNVLGTASVVSNQRVANGQNPLFVRWENTSTVEIAANTTHRLAIKPSTTSAVNSIEKVTLSSASLMQAAPGGAEWYYTHRVDGGGWTDVTAERVLCTLHLSAIHE